MWAFLLWALLSALAVFELVFSVGVELGVPVGFEAIRLGFDVDAPNASAEEIESLVEKTERYCVVLQMLTEPPRIDAAIAE